MHKFEGECNSIVTTFCESGKIHNKYFNEFVILLTFSFWCFGSFSKRKYAA